MKRISSFNSNIVSNSDATLLTTSDAQGLLEQCGLEVALVFQQLRKSIGSGIRENTGRVKIQTIVQNVYAAAEARPVRAGSDPLLRLAPWTGTGGPFAGTRSPS